MNPRSQVCVALGFVCLMFPGSASAKMNPDSNIAITNLVEVLPYISDFVGKLELESPHPLETNRVTRFSGYRPKRGYGRETVSVTVDRKLHFHYDVEHLLVYGFTDDRYSMRYLWRAEDIKPLIRPSKITKAQALETARKCLKRLGYSEKELPLLPPRVNQWTWEPPGAPKPELLPFFTVEWPFSKHPDWEYFTIEIDGYREKVTHFSTIHPRQDPPVKE